MKITTIALDAGLTLHGMVYEGRADFDDSDEAYRYLSCAQDSECSCPSQGSEALQQPCC